MALFKSSSDFSDAISLLAFCPGDNSYMFTQDSPSSEYWIPSSKIPLGASLSKQLASDIVEVDYFFIFGMVIKISKKFSDLWQLHFM